MLSRVIWPGIQASEGDESIRARQGRPLEGVDQSGPGDGPTPVIVHKRVQFCLRSGFASTKLRGHVLGQMAREIIDEGSHGRQ